MNWDKYYRPTLPAPRSGYVIRDNKVLIRLKLFLSLQENSLWLKPTCIQSRKINVCVVCYCVDQNALKTQLKEQNQRLLAVTQEKARLEAKNKINQMKEEEGVGKSSFAVQS